MRTASLAAVVFGLAGCAPRQVDNWYPSSLAAAAANGESFMAAGADELSDAEVSAARATLGEIYNAQWKLDYIAANRAGVKRSDEDWQRLKSAIEDAYARLEAAASLPIETLSRGPETDEVSAAIAGAEAVVGRFAGGPPPGARTDRIRP